MIPHDSCNSPVAMRSGCRLVDGVTPAEERVLAAVMQGLSNRAIASLLVVIRRPVESPVA